MTARAFYRRAAKVLKWLSGSWPTNSSGKNHAAGARENTGIAIWSARGETWIDRATAWLAVLSLLPAAAISTSTDYSPHNRATPASEPSKLGGGKNPSPGVLAASKATSAMIGRRRPGSILGDAGGATGGLAAIGVFPGAALAVDTLRTTTTRRYASSAHADGGGGARSPAVSPPQPPGNAVLHGGGLCASARRHRSALIGWGGALDADDTAAHEEDAATAVAAWFRAATAGGWGASPGHVGSDASPQRCLLTETASAATAAPVAIAAPAEVPPPRTDWRAGDWSSLRDFAPTTTGGGGGHTVPGEYQFAGASRKRAAALDPRPPRPSPYPESVLANLLALGPEEDTAEAVTTIVQAEYGSLRLAPGSHLWAIVASLRRAGRWRLALVLFSCAPKLADEPPTAAACHAALAAASMGGQGAIADLLVARMSTLGHASTSAVLEVRAGLVGRMGRATDALTVWTEGLESGLPLPELQSLAGVVITTLGFGGCGDAALRVFAECTAAAGDDETLRATPDLCNRVIQALGRCGRPQAVLDTFEWMRAAGVAPSAVTYINLAEALVAPPAGAAGASAAVAAVEEGVESSHALGCYVSDVSKFGDCGHHVKLRNEPPRYARAALLAYCRHTRRLDKRRIKLRGGSVEIACGRGWRLVNLAGMLHALGLPPEAIAVADARGALIIDRALFYRWLRSAELDGDVAWAALAAPLPAGAGDGQYERRLSEGDDAVRDAPDATRP